MERADFSNSANEEPGGRRSLAENREELTENRAEAGGDSWAHVLRLVIQSKDIAYAAIWNAAGSESNFVTEAGQRNAKILFVQRVECCVSAQRGSGNIPLVVQKSDVGADVLVMSFLMLAKGHQQVGLELQFADEVTVEAGTNTLQAIVESIGSLGWHLAKSNIDNIAPNTGASRTDAALAPLPKSDAWVWTGTNSSRALASSHSQNGTDPEKLESTIAHGLLRGQPKSATQDSQFEQSTKPTTSSGLHEQDYRRFVRQVHLSLDPTETSYAVANECRRLLGCERVTVLWFHRGRFVVKAISGQPAVNRRSKWVQLLEQLANRTLQVGRGLDYPNPDPLAPQIAQPLETYLLESRSRSLTILPIYERDPSLESEEADLQKKRRGANRVIAGLVLESLTAEGEYHGKVTALVSAQEIGGDALRAANRHRQLFLYPLWHLLGRTKTMALARRLPVAVIAGLVLIGLLALAFFPATFYVSSEGTLVPQAQQRIYAPMDGIVEAVLVKPNDLIGVGQPLLRMRNFELDVKVRRVEGELEMVTAQIEARHRLDRSPTDKNFEFWNQLDGMPVNVLEARQANLRTQLSLLQQQTQMAVVNSQVAGRVLTWNVQEELKDRPVPMGRLLMEVADTDGQWELELNLPDRRVGHLLEAMSRNEDSLQVEFVMAAEPTRRFSGRVTKVAPVTAASTEDGSYVKVRVALEAADVRVLQTNTDVSAKIMCGQASLGYVWLQDVLEFLERQVFFYVW